MLKSLLGKFGNLKNLLDASVEELADVPGMGRTKAGLLFDKLKKLSEYYLYNEPYNHKGEIVPKLRF